MNTPDQKTSHPNQNFCSESLFLKWSTLILLFPQMESENGFNLLSNFLEESTDFDNLSKTVLSETQVNSLESKMKTAHSVRGGNVNVPRYRFNSLFVEQVDSALTLAFRFIVTANLFLKGLNYLNDVKRDTQVTKKEKLKRLEVLSEQDQNLLSILKRLVKVFLKRMKDKTILELAKERNSSLFAKEKANGSFIGQMRRYIYEEAYEDFDDDLRNFFQTRELYLVFLNKFLYNK